MTDREAAEMCRDALHRYMFATSVRTQRLAHQHAEEVMKIMGRHLVGAKAEGRYVPSE